MRIAILGSRGYPYVYSGYETFVSELAPRLVRLGNDVTVYCHSKLFRDKPREVSGVRLVYLPAIELKTLSQFSHSLLSACHAALHRFDIVFFVNSANGPFGIIMRIFGVRTVINVDGLEWMRPKWKGLGAKYFYCASLAATRFFDCLVTDSIRMAEIYRNTFGASSETIAYGAEIQESLDRQLLARYGLDNGGYYLVVARLVPDNNADLIVKGFLASSSQRKLVIVGDVPYKDKYADEVKATKDPRVLFTGYVYDKNLLRELYCNCYVYIHGHEHGGTNPTLLKALGDGCCILALDTVFSREVLCDEKYGRLFSKNADAVASMIDELDSDALTVARYRSGAQERIRTNYTWEKITAQYVNLFASIMKPGVK